MTANNNANFWVEAAPAATKMSIQFILCEPQNIHVQRAGKMLTAFQKELVAPDVFRLADANKNKISPMQPCGWSYSIRKDCSPVRRAPSQRMGETVREEYKLI